MNTHKTISLLAAAFIVAGQAALLAVDTRSTTQEDTGATYQNVYEARFSPAHAVYATALAPRAAGSQDA
ncbi:MAG: hypothetical protein ACRES2_01205 [Steroidobacteraceae bacterium]